MKTPTSSKMKLSLAAKVLLGLLVVSVLIGGCQRSGQAKQEYLLIHKHESGGGFEERLQHIDISGPGICHEVGSWKEAAGVFDINPDKVEGYYIVEIMNRLGKKGWRLVSLSETPAPTQGGDIHHVSQTWVFGRDR